MIEALIDYIRQKGWIVHVLPHVLMIERIVTVKEEVRVFQYGWSITQVELNYRPIESFLDEIEHILAKMEQAIQDAS